MKKISLILVLIGLASCRSKDEQFCTCLQAGKALNNYASTLLSQQISEEKAAKLIALKRQKNKPVRGIKQ
jgi:hypothetical protein